MRTSILLLAGLAATAAGQPLRAQADSTIGRASAVAQSGRLRMSGFVAWLAWCFIHILYLIGFRNRLLVFIQWVWSYVRYRRGARLITERDWKLGADAAAATGERSSPAADDQAEHRASA